MNLIERLKELEAKAMPGPWEVHLGTVIFNKHNRVVTSATNAALIAEMRNALPKLLAVVEAAKLAEWHLNAYQMKDTGLTDALAALEQP